MTREQLQIARALRNVRTGMRPFAARFIGDLVGWADTEPARVISERQEEWLYRLAVMFRRQIPSYVVGEAQRQALKLAWHQRDRRIGEAAAAPVAHPVALPGQFDLFSPQAVA